MESGKSNNKLASLFVEQLLHLVNHAFDINVSLNELAHALYFILQAHKTDYLVYPNNKQSNKN
jgi:hypothetical protein